MCRYDDFLELVEVEMFVCGGGGLWARKFISRPADESLDLLSVPVHIQRDNEDGEC